MNVLKRQSTEKSVSLGQFGVQTMSQCINYMDFLLCTVINIPMCELNNPKSMFGLGSHFVSRIFQITSADLALFVRLPL